MMEFGLLQKLFVRRNFKSKANRKKRVICKRYKSDMLKKASKIALMNAMIDFYEIKDFRIEY